MSASDSKREVLSLLSQFITDILDTLGFLLRFLVLMARLNLYDFLDDILDSYYIFVCDFDDDEYYPDLLLAIHLIMTCDVDLNEDRLVFFEDELDLSLDLFSSFFILWSKFSLFFFFAVEECLRLLLAFFITYLILFEVQALNRSYIEDLYLFKKR